MGLMSITTRNRVKRTALQCLAGGLLGGFATVILADDVRRALLASVLTAVGTVVTSWFQNVLEDVSRVTDRRL